MKSPVKNLRNEKWSRVRFPKATKKNHYEISNHGRIKSINKITKTESLISGSVGKRGFRSINVRLSPEGYGRKFIHRYVAEKFVKKPSRKHSYIIHKDLNRENNKYTNLKWVTEEQWKKYFKKLPSYLAGRKKLQKNFKLTEAKVRQIKKCLRAGGIPKEKLQINTV